MNASKATHLSIETDGDIYQLLRGSDPIKYGELLLKMQSEGLSQTAIAKKLSCNRQMVGRYQRMGNWSDEVKSYIKTNSNKISNTQMIGLASRSLTTEELLSEVRNTIGESINSKGGSLKPFPTVNGFNELIAKLESIEKRLENLEEKRENPTRTHLSSLVAIPTETPKNELNWSSLIEISIKPARVLLMICITLLTSYLVYQGIVFFSAIDPQPVSAISSAVVSEFIPFLAAACFALAAKFSHRIVSLAILLTSIVGLGIFMHDSLSNQITQGSGRFERLTNSRNLALASIAAQTTTLGALPEAFATKRQEASRLIAVERENLSKIDREIDSLENSGGDFRNMDLSYSVWIRFAAMILNAYLIHLFFGRFRSLNQAVEQTVATNQQYRVGLSL